MTLANFVPIRMHHLKLIYFRYEKFVVSMFTIVKTYQIIVFIFVFLSEISVGQKVHGSFEEPMTSYIAKATKWEQWDRQWGRLSRS